MGGSVDASDDDRLFVWEEGDGEVADVCNGWRWESMTPMSRGRTVRVAARSLGVVWRRTFNHWMGSKTGLRDALCMG